MKTHFSYDAAVDAWTLSHEDLHVDSHETLEQWRTQVNDALQALGGKRGFILIDVSGVHIAPEYKDAYGKTAKEVLSKHALGIVRYGIRDAATKRAVLISSAENQSAANVVPDREAAIRTLAVLRTQK